jgi:hypothetical protein
MAGNTCSYRHITTDLVIGVCGALAVTETAVTIQGVRVGDNVVANCRQAFPAGLAVAGCRVSADNTVQLGIVNATAAGIDPVDTYDFDWTVIRATGNVS